MAVFSLCPFMVEGACKLYGVSLIRAPVPSMRAPQLRPSHLSKIPSPNANTLGMRFQHKILEWGWQHKHSGYSSGFFYLSSLSLFTSNTCSPWKQRNLLFILCPQIYPNTWLKVYSQKMCMACFLVCVFPIISSAVLYSLLVLKKKYIWNWTTHLWNNQFDWISFFWTTFVCMVV